MLQITAGWREAHPGACVGLLAVDKVTNPESDDRLEAAKSELEGQLKERYRTREDLLTLEHIQVYRDYYRRFGKTYFVLLQMESVAVKGKPFPREAALVEAMFMAEVKNGLLTAGHDLASLAAPLVLDVAADGEGYTGISGREQATRAGDMLMRDREGIISSVVFGPDFRTRITATTMGSLFVVYAPPGVAAGLVERHLQDILANVRLFAPAATPVGGGIFR
jgi:DNA/RNA-binding domain of Phe-tRNA-synthetase-like protein